MVPRRPALEMQVGTLEGREMVLRPSGHPSFPDAPEGGAGGNLTTVRTVSGAVLRADTHGLQSS